MVRLARALTKDGCQRRYLVNGLYIGINIFEILQCINLENPSKINFIIKQKQINLFNLIFFFLKGKKCIFMFDLRKYTFVIFKRERKKITKILYFFIFFRLEKKKFFIFFNSSYLFSKNKSK